MNICAECKYFKKNAFDETKYHTCTNLECRNPVSGYGQTCVELRKKTGLCGVQGNFWVIGFVGKVISPPLKVIKKSNG